MNVSLCRRVSIFLGAIAFTSAVAHADDKAGITDKSVKVGVTAPVSGPIPALGEAIRNSILFAFDEVNKAGGIHGRTIEIVFEDDGCSGGTAVSALKKLISRDQVFGLVSGTCAGATVASFPVARSADVPVLGPYAMPDAILDPFNPNLFLMNISILRMGAADVDFAAEHFKAKRIAIIYQADEYGRGALKGSTASAAQRGIEVVASESVERGTTDLTAQVLRLRDLKPDVTILHIYSLQSAFVIRKARELNVDTKFVVDVASADPRVLLEQAGKEAMTDRVAVLSIVRDPAAANTQTQGFVDRYKKHLPTYTARPGVPGIDDFVGYSAASVFIEALKRSGRDLSRKKFVGAMETIKDFETIGISPVTFGADNHRGAKVVRFFTFDADGKIRLLERAY